MFGATHTRKAMSKSKLADLSIAVATMHGRGLVSRFFNQPYVIVDQGDHPPSSAASFQNYHFSTSRGLSISRNEALRICKTKYLLFSDDDVIHIEDGIQKIVDEFERTGADILTFSIRTPEGGAFKEYRDHPFIHTPRSLFKVNSIEIAVRVAAMRRSGLRFDTRFGLGAEHPTGEEIIFLQDAHRTGLDIRYAPVPIVIHPRESSGSNLKGNEALIQAKGAMFGRIFGTMAYLYCTAFAAKHYRNSDYSFPKFLCLIFKGCRTFLRSSEYESISQ